ncbi:uncharacterized protein LOC130825143 [Amaranthus tricolor]|uniref:uncharacterized protein LOC130825143 n=1 Tax=Amaranthus tricolor TaxID=29722 RepID=UPI00258CB7AE|nr:uncharacterized protein LOC130825143 [Amaranthus tricolor]
MGKKKRFQPETEKQEENKQSNEVFNGDCDSEEPKRKKKKKQKRSQSETEHQEQTKQSNEVFNGDANTEEPKRTKKKKKNKHHSEEIKVIPTVSIAIPSSIIGNAQSDELATRLAGQIARAATIFRIDEVVVFDNNSTSRDDPTTTNMGTSEGDRRNAAFFIRILRYLETPQYLRKHLIPRHSNLRCVGLLPPLDAPHHLRKHEWASYREGVTLQEKAPNSVGTLVDVGLDKNVVIDKALESGTRVTVAMGTDRNLSTGTLLQVVDPSTPREQEGMYWGYKVRYAPNLSSVIENCTYEGGYDYVIGTSEHGQVIKSSELCVPAFRHLLIAFGGLAGLEECIEQDKKLKGKDASFVFHSYLNLCPHQGSRTIRSEEAVFIALQYFQEPVERALQKS